MGKDHPPPSTSSTAPITGETTTRNGSHTPMNNVKSRKYISNPEPRNPCPDAASQKSSVTVAPAPVSYAAIFEATMSSIREE